MNATQQQQKGFTIIEVVLVLAIAGLIFLMIFIAWPALQRNQRDTAKKNDVAVIATALGTWKSNNRGALPDSSTFVSKFIPNYVQSLSQYEPSSDVHYHTISGLGTNDTQITVQPNSGGIDINEIWVIPAAKCSETAENVKKGSSRQVAIVAVIESGAANGTVYCQEG